jgi:hypothetical protein
LFSSAHAPFDLPEAGSTSSSYFAAGGTAMMNPYGGGGYAPPKPWHDSAAAGAPDLSEWFNYGFSEETFIYFINQ